ncbi:hypothetical protein FRX31_011165 [Thalictrum thalictroides]|uniref:KIB1-4 beta-propeller domain-containing protein n=1 Tax=Thalictrum thalictroides TaxID=46969 RepID=A0A7J6WQN9_THATH|nr:hypothetical protein FRX31_011165 [Thalictrum thalictroides]
MSLPSLQRCMVAATFRGLCALELTNRLVLCNLFTLNKIDVPSPKLRVIVSRISQGTFSTISKSPNCVIFVAKNIRTRTRDMYAWKIGSNTWKTYQLHWDYCGGINWLYDHLYCFSGDRVMVFDNDLNLKRRHNFNIWIDDTFNITESDQELFAVPWPNSNYDSYKFDRANLDWAKVNVRILIGFKNEFNCNIGFMVKEQWDEVFFTNEELEEPWLPDYEKGRTGYC